jgi:hypothetical protein
MRLRLPCGGWELMALNTAETDHYTPLSRAVASIDRDAYAARFAIYDRAHKALLKRLATAPSPPTPEDIEREEKAFREAVRRVEFADELAQEEAESPALVPQHEPPAEEEVEALHELRRDPWPDVRPRRESTDTPEDYAGDEGYEPDIDLGALAPDRSPRSVTRRVSERLLLAICVLALGGMWLFIADQRQQQAIEAARTAPPPADTEAPAPAPDVRSSAPSWLSSPELFYTAPQFPTAPAAAPPRAPQAPPPARRPALPAAPNP